MENKTTFESTNNAMKRLLRGSAVFAFTVSILAFMIPLVIIDFTDPESTHSLLGTCIVLGLIAVMLVLSILLLCKQNNCYGYYRCEECGHVHIPSIEGIADLLNSDKSGCILCPNCQEVTKHKKLASKQKENQTLTKVWKLK